MKSAIDERPILFKDQMIHAILAGIKRKTRRVVAPDIAALWESDEYSSRPSLLERCPYGRPNSRLWVRECFSTDHAAFYPHFPVIYRAEGYDPRDDMEVGTGERQGQVFSSETQTWYPFKWRPSIFCRREYSRIDLFVESVGIERVQDITEKDAIAEGMQRNCPEWNLSASVRKCPGCASFDRCQNADQFIHDGLKDEDFPVTAREAFRYLWDVINGKREGCSWDDNPWVWVIGFHRLRKGVWRDCRVNRA